jgi:hypothetical protein
MNQCHYRYKQSTKKKKKIILFHENYVCIKTKPSKFLQQGFSYLSLLNGDIEVNYSSKTAKIKVLQGKKNIIMYINHVPK